MQNLTARYNILYNAKELVNESERNINLTYQDNFENFIPVFKDPDESLAQPELKKLDDAILKSNTIVNEKFQSKFVDDAYFLIARANHFKANFYNSAEYFTYVYQSFPKEKELRQAALVYKARSLISSNRYEEAESTIDSAFKYISSEKKSVADINALRSQLFIYSRQYDEAIPFLQKAISLSKSKENKIRWTFLLAQLQNHTGKTEAAASNYLRIIKSNAPFNMAFNALLNRITIEDEKSGKKIDRAEQLNSLLKDDKNRDFLDQIYYEIGNSYAAENDLENAIENYNNSLRQNSRNQNQKGLSYLKLADLYLNQSDFIKAKTYYDSTLTNLSPQSANYELIRKKSSNLSLLASRLTTISEQDTLQMLASLPEAERKTRIGILARQQAQKSISSDGTIQNNIFYSNTQPFENKRDGKFYFNNTTALSQGLSDFKRRWGNRKLEDNWRRSLRSSADIANATSAEPDFPGIMIPENPDQVAITPQNLESRFADNIPLTADQKAASDQKIESAYYDIANYYREVLGDSPKAIRNYEILIGRFPESSFKLPVYYNLYRLYADINPEKSQQYKNILLTQYPQTPFAKIILDPSFNQQTDVMDVALNKSYNEIYNLYESKKYTEVLNSITEAEKNFGQNSLSPQLAYLNALAIGHTQKLPALDTAFRQITRDFPEDKLIVPLVQQHLVYLENNREMMGRRLFALLDEDPNEPRFVEEPRTQPVQQQVIVKNSDKQNDPVKTTGEKEEIVQTNPEIANIPKPLGSSFLALVDSAEYYFVVNVLDPSLNLSSSRFGIGQFNRTNFAGGAIKHQLKAVNNQNQLIFVGVFFSKSDVVDYYRNINPLIKNIMKIPADKYNTFFISKQNLDKLNDREMVNQYIDFYQKNF